jgi:hypothetical protein
MPDFGIFRGFNEKLFGDKLYAGQLPTQLGLIGSESFDFIGVLDLYPNAKAAYSFRKLRNAYTGSAIRVRRAVGSPSEKDIGFFNNELDVADLESFCSGTNGFVTTWYDQSGNAINASQTTAANQPQIVSSGTVLTLNSKPTLKTGVNGFLSTTGTHFNSTQTSIIAVAKLDAGTGLYRRLVCINVFSNGYYLGSEPSGDVMVGIANGTFTSIGGKKFSQTISWVYNDATKLYLLSNNVEVGSASLTMTSYGNQDLFIATQNGTSFEYWEGNIQEVIVYPNSQGANATGINTNINDFYSIY